jgi:hypothetical protein
MSRDSKISYDSVAAVCNAIAAQGRKPTFAAIREQVGGSYEVIKRHLTRWLEESTSATKYALPDDLANELGLWFQKARREAQIQADESLSNQIDLLGAERSLLIEERDRARLELEVIKEVANQNGHDLSIQRLQGTVKQSQLTELQQALADAMAKCASIEKQNQYLKDQLVVQAGEFSKVVALHDEQLKSADERSRGTEKALLMRHHSEVQSIKDKAAALHLDNEGLKVRLVAAEHRCVEATRALDRSEGALSVLK